MSDDGKSLFAYLDCVELYVPDIRRGIEYYCGRLGLKLLWKKETQAGLGMNEGETEVVIQSERRERNVDFRVASVAGAVTEIVKAGGRVVHGPFDIPIGKCAVVADPWDNTYVILDATKGTYITDAEGNIVGHNPPEAAEPPP